LANAHDYLGHIARDTLGDYKQAREHYLAAIELRKQVLEQKPNDEGRKVDMANEYGYLAITSLREGKVDQAAGELNDSLQWWSRLSPEAEADIGNRRQFAGLWDRMGEAAFKLGRPAEALDHYAKALEIREKLEQEGRESKGGPGLLIAALRDLALSHLEIGDTNLFLKGDVSVSEGEYKMAKAYLDESEKLDPESAGGLRYLSNALYRLGVTHAKKNEMDLSRADFAKCIELRRKIYAGDPDGLEANSGLMVALARSGEHQEAAGIADQLVQIAPNDPRFLFEASCAYSLCEAAAKADAGAGQGAEAQARASLAAMYADKAIGALKQSVKSGWRDGVTLKTDPDLDEVRDDPRFSEIVKDLETSGASAPSSEGTR
jgi:tetratricopeptide (TPR) repeat protein